MSKTCISCEKALGSRDKVCYKCSQEMSDEEREEVAGIFDGVEDV